MAQALAQTATLDDIFAPWDRADSPGCAVGVVRGGELTFARGYGIANLDLDVPLAPNSVLHVASVSKQFTGVALAQLAREGLLGLDDDVRQYVPELPDFGQPLTLRQLAQHTSGLRDQYALFRLAGWRDGDVQTFEDVLEFARAHRRLNYPPGTEYGYCNTSYTLLALSIERVSGQRLPDFVHERIFAPLGMTHSHIHHDVTAIVPGRASAYAPREGGGFKVADSHVEAFGAICLYTSVEDLALWLRNLRDRAVVGDAIVDATTPGRLSDGTPLRYGLGLQLGSYRGQRTVSHGGVDAGYRAELLWLPDADFGVLVLANLSTIKPGALARRVVDAYLAGRLEADELLDAPAVALSDDAQRYAGLYRDARTALTRRVALEDGQLSVNAGFGERQELTPLGNGRFRHGEPPQAARFVGPADGPLDYIETANDGRETRFTAASRAEPTPATLASYAGAYACPELNARWTFFVRDEQLILRRRRLDDCALEPTIADGFTFQSYDLVFTRDGRGDVTGFELFAERIRHLRFERER
jgi:CubicO group peptidase (beta-lactamase class C family)